MSYSILYYWGIASLLLLIGFLLLCSWALAKHVFGSSSTQKQSHYRLWFQIGPSGFGVGVTLAGI